MLWCLFNIFCNIQRYSDDIYSVLYCVVISPRCVALSFMGKLLCKTQMVLALLSMSHMLCSGIFKMYCAMLSIKSSFASELCGWLDCASIA